MATGLRLFGKICIGIAVFLLAISVFNLVKLTGAPPVPAPPGPGGTAQEMGRLTGTLLASIIVPGLPYFIGRACMKQADDLDNAA